LFAQQLELRWSYQSFEREGNEERRANRGNQKNGKHKILQEERKTRVVGRNRCRMPFLVRCLSFMSDAQQQTGSRVSRRHKEKQDWFRKRGLSSIKLSHRPISQKFGSVLDRLKCIETLKDSGDDSIECDSRRLLKRGGDYCRGWEEQHRKRKKDSVEDQKRPIVIDLTGDTSDECSEENDPSPSTVVGAEAKVETIAYFYYLYAERKDDSPSVQVEVVRDRRCPLCSLCTVREITTNATP